MKRLHLAVLLPLTACHWGFKSHPDEGRYLIGMPGEPWIEVNAGSADHAWFNQEQSAAIYTDSNCGRRYEDSSLESLIEHVTRGIAQGEPSRELNLLLAEREALVRAWTGAIDGVKIHVGAMVVKRNNCIYDALFIAPEAHFEANWSHFEHVYRGFRVEEK